MEVMEYLNNYLTKKLNIYIFFTFIILSSVKLFPMDGEKPGNIPLNDNHLGQKKPRQLFDMQAGKSTPSNIIPFKSKKISKNDFSHLQKHPFPPPINNNVNEFENAIYDMLLEDSWQPESKQKGPHKPADVIQLTEKKSSIQPSSSKIKKSASGTVIHLDEAEARARKNWLDAQRNSPKLPQSWTQAYWETGQKDIDKYLQYEKIKEANEYQKKSAISQSSGTPKVGPWEQNTIAAKKHGETPPPPSSFASEVATFSKVILPGAKMAANGASELICQSDIAKNSEFCKSRLPISRDAVIDESIRTGVEAALFTVSPILFTASMACTQAKAMRESTEEIDFTAKSVPSNSENSFLDRMGDAYGRISLNECQQSIDSLKFSLAVGEYLDDSKKRFVNDIASAVKAKCDARNITDESIKKNIKWFFDSVDDAAIAARNAIGLNDENISTIRAYVNHGARAIRNGYRELLATKEASAAQATLSNQHSLVPGAAKHPTFIPPLPPRKPQQIKNRNESTQYEQVANEYIASSIDEYNLQVRSAIANTITKAQLANLEPIEDFAPAQEEFNYPRFRNNIYDGFRGLSAIATIFGHDNTAYRLSTIGGASIQAMDAISNFLDNGLMCGINPYVGILSAVASISTLFRKKNKDNSSQIILDAINNGIMHLSEQIYRFHKNVMEQFVELHGTLNRHHLAILDQFFALYQNQEQIVQRLELLQEYIQDNHAAIQNGLNVLHQQADTNFRMTVDNLNGLRIEEIDDLIERSYLVLKRDDLSPEEFGKCIEKIYIKGLSRASADTLTGGGINIKSLDAIQTALEGLSSQNNNIFAHPAFSNINLLSKYLEQMDNDFGHEKLVNPLIWIKCVEAILNLINQKIEADDNYPPTEKVKNIDIDKLIVLKEQGKKIISFIEKIGKNECLRKIVDDYEICLRELANAIKQEQLKYEEKHSQQLLREHVSFIDNEKSKTSKLAETYDCKKCVEHVTQALNTLEAAHTLKQSAPGSSLLQKRATFCVKGTPIVPVLFDSALGRNRTVQDIHNPIDKFRKLYQKYQNELRVKEAGLNDSVKLDLSEDSYAAINNGISAWIYPVDEDSDLPKLMLPRENLPIDPLYITAEYRGEGRITHQYYITERDFNFESYFKFKDDNRKIKILHLAKAHDFHHDMYDLVENVKHFWYGGAYPKSPDTYAMPYGLINVKGVVVNRPTGFYPPENPYPAERNSFVSTARREVDQSANYRQEVSECIQMDLQEKRLDFNQKITNHLLLRSSASEIFKAAQRLDVYFKLLDALLTFMYNDLLQNSNSSLQQQFICIKHEDDHYPKNFSGIIKYLTQYSDERNPESRQLNYLPYYIAQTAEKIEDATQQILSSSMKPKFNRVARVMRDIDILIHKYTKRKVTLSKSIILRKARNTIRDDKEIPGEKDSQIALLIESNSVLVEEVHDLKKQIAVMQNQFTKTMALVLAKLEGTVVSQEKIEEKSNFVVDTPSTSGYDYFEVYDSSEDLNDNESKVSKVAQFLDFCDQDGSSYKTYVKKVRQQIDAECGYHALCNALQCFNKKLLPDKLIPYFKNEIAKHREEIGNDQWLSEDELSSLAEKYKGVCPITLISDISMYHDGITGLERSVLQDLAKAQKAIKMQTNYQHVFILGTMDARNNNRFAHWIAVELLINDCKIVYSVMDSLSAHVAPQVEQLQAILHIDEERFDINLLRNENTEERIGDYLSQLALAAIFEEGKRCYAREGDQTEECPLVVNKAPELLINNIIYAAKSLIEEMHDNSFWSTEGYIRPAVIIIKAFNSIRGCDHENLLCKDNSNDLIPDSIPVLELTKQQKKQMKSIERYIATLGSVEFLKK